MDRSNAYVEMQRRRAAPLQPASGYLGPAMADDHGAVYLRLG